MNTDNLSQLRELYQQKSDHDLLVTNTAKTDILYNKVVSVEKVQLNHEKRLGMLEGARKTKRAKRAFKIALPIGSTTIFAITIGVIELLTGFISQYLPFWGIICQ